MKTILSGIIALFIPLFLLAQTAKEAQDLSQVQKKVTALEKSNAMLRQQIVSMQKTINQINEAEVAEHLNLVKQESMFRAGQDSILKNSGKLYKIDEDIAEIEHSLFLRCIGMILFTAVLILLGIILWLTHRKTHRKDLEEIYARMTAQREEREQRISELRALVEQSALDFAAMKNETGERFAVMHENIAQVDKNLQKLLSERSDSLEHQIKEGLTGLRKDYHTGSTEFVKKLEEMQALANLRINEIAQKLTDSGRKLDEQITSAHKKTEELKTVLAREIEAIRSKFE